MSALSMSAPSSRRPIVLGIAIAAAIGIAIPSIAFGLSCAFPAEEATLTSTDPAFDGTTMTIQASYGGRVELRLYDPESQQTVFVDYIRSETP